MSQHFEEIEKIGRVEGDTPSAGLDREIEPVDRVAPNKDHFESLMSQSRTQPQPVEKAAAVDEVQKPSLFDEVRKLNQNVDHVSRASPAEVAKQAEGLISQIEEIKDKLKTPNLELKSSYQNILHNKLTHIDDNLRIALSKAGVEYKVPEVETAKTNPIDRFLGYLTDGQYQLQHLHHDLQGIADQRGQISPASMLAIQVKVTFITQELEFFTSVLNKALESTKTLMNVQV